VTLNGTRPHVKAAGQVLGDYFRFSDAEMGGVRPDAIPDHPSGVAIDFMGGSNMSRCQNLFVGVQSRPDVWKYLNIRYVIWQQTYYDAPGKPGSKMENRGSPTANHMDHVHITFQQLGAIPNRDGFLAAMGGAGIPVAGVITPGVAETAGEGLADAAAQTLGMVKQIYDALTKIGAAFSFMTDPKNWWRIALFVLGVGIGLAGVIKLDAPGAATATKAVAKVVKT
jgi:hypothetical protein